MTEQKRHVTPKDIIQGLAKNIAENIARQIAKSQGIEGEVKCVPEEVNGQLIFRCYAGNKLILEFKPKDNKL